MHGPDPTKNCLVVDSPTFVVFLRSTTHVHHSGKWFLFGRRTILGSGTGPSASEQYIGRPTISDDPTQDAADDDEPQDPEESQETKIGATVAVAKDSATTDASKIQEIKS